MERARQGDTAAFALLVQRHEQIAFRTAYLITGSPEDAEEAAQDGFTKAYFALGRFHPGAPFRPWLLQIIANESRNRRKSSGRYAGHILRLDDSAPLMDHATPEQAALLKDQRQRLLEAVNTLRQEERAVVICRYFLELSEEETAAVLGRPRGTVKSRLSRALPRLRALLPAIDSPSPIRPEAAQHD